MGSMHRASRVCGRSDRAEFLRGAAVTGEEAAHIRREVLHMSPTALAKALRMRGKNAPTRIRGWETGRDDVPGWVEVIFAMVRGCEACRAKFITDGGRNLAAP